MKGFSDVAGLARRLTSSGMEKVTYYEHNLTLFFVLPKTNGIKVSLRVFEGIVMVYSERRPDKDDPNKLENKPSKALSDRVDQIRMFTTKQIKKIIKMRGITTENWVFILYNNDEEEKLELATIYINQFL